MEVAALDFGHPFVLGSVLPLPLRTLFCRASSFSEALLGCAWSWCGLLPQCPHLEVLGPGREGGSSAGIQGQAMPADGRGFAEPGPQTRCPAHPGRVGPAPRSRPVPPRHSDVSTSVGSSTWIPAYCPLRRQDGRGAGVSGPHVASSVIVSGDASSFGGLCGPRRWSVHAPTIAGALFSSGFYIAINILHLPNKVVAT